MFSQGISQTFSNFAVKYSLHELFDVYGPRAFFARPPNCVPDRVLINYLATKIVETKVHYTHLI
jgi:hypothetical protein